MERVIHPGRPASMCQAFYLWGLSLAEHNRKIQNDSGSEQIEVDFFFFSHKVGLEQAWQSRDSGSPTRPHTGFYSLTILPCLDWQPLPHGLLWLLVFQPSYLHSRQQDGKWGKKRDTPSLLRRLSGINHILI